MKIILNTDLETNKNRLNKQDLRSDLGMKYGYLPSDFIEGNSNGEVFHKNYLEYLDQCYSNHYGAVITPDIIWYTLLCEISLVIRENTEKVRQLFSSSSEKQEIIVNSTSLTRIPLDSLINGIKNRMPTDIDSYLPTFSTTDQNSRFAVYAAFADAVSPYYSYGMKLCGIPHVTVKGYKEDWVKLKNAWVGLPSLLSSCDLFYWDKVSQILDLIIDSFNKENPLFWNNIFTSKRCGSGSDVEIDGWFSQLYRKQPEGLRYSCNFNSHLSIVEYKSLDTGRNYKMYVGMTNSIIEGDTLIPKFGDYIFEVVDRESLPKGEVYKAWR